jgi:hypothetical protein
MKALIFILVVLLTGSDTVAQKFHPAVKIEFEKTVYVRQVYKELESEWYENIKARLP